MNYYTRQLNKLNLGSKLSIKFYDFEGNNTNFMDINNESIDTFIKFLQDHKESYLKAEAQKERFSDVYTLLNKLDTTAYQYAHNNRQVEDYHRAKQIFVKMMAQAQKNEDYKTKLLQWLNGETSTIALRELCQILGYNYWKSLDISNTIDFIDSMQININHLKK